MPEEFQHTHDLKSRQSKRSTSTSAAGTESNAPPERTDASTAGRLPQFSLLADPETIADEGRRGAGAADHDEVGRLRAALRARSRELSEFQNAQSGQETTDPNAPLIQHPLTLQSDGTLLDAAQARQLAVDARAREQAIRAELSAAQDAFRKESERDAPATDPDAPNAQWEKRSLVRSEPSVHPPRVEAPAPDLSRVALQAELREIRATLAVARDTTRGQKQEISALRNQLASKDQQLAEATREKQGLEAAVAALRRSGQADSDSHRASDEERAELDALRARLEDSRRDSEERATEGRRLRHALAERDREIAEQRRQHDDLEDRLEAQQRALEIARQQFEQERSRNTATQRLLKQLRQTLGSDAGSDVVNDSGDASRDSPRDNETLTLADTATLPATQEAALGSFVAREVERPTTEAFPDALHGEGLEAAADMGADEPAGPAVSGFVRPVAFDTWQDDQIRRQFGPMGIDGIVDLLRAPLARRAADRPGEQALLLIGRGAGSWAPALAEVLVQNGASSFVIHVCDEGEARGAHSGRGSVGELRDESPIRDFLRETAFPDSPERLRSLLTEIDPSAVISRDFLSRQVSPAPWLDALSEAANDGTCLLFSERTGIGPVTPPDEIRAIGDRIWERMPERYTHLPGESTRWNSWGAAFAEAESQTDASRGNDLLVQLRRRFRLEMLTRFGFLAESFVNTPIALNFDLSAARDRKFLNQIADLDDRKIEAGIAPALHLVAVVDREADGERDGDGEGVEAGVEP